MSALAERNQIAEPRSVDAGVCAAWTIETVGIEVIEADWRALEASGVATPYQRYDWVRAYVSHAISSDHASAHILRVRARNGQTVAILPFALRRAGGLRTVSFIGGKHANFHMGVFSPAFAASLDSAGARQLLNDASVAMGGVDAFILHNQPHEWEGHPNALALLDAQPSPSQAYKLPLLPDCEATLQNSMSSHARKKHKNKRARFAELGPSRVIIAETADVRARILDAFHRQKTARFAQMGVADPFDNAGIRAFLAQASDPSEHDPSSGPEPSPRAQPSLRLGALELNGELVATYVGAVHQTRFSGMATSFEPDPAVMKVSPGEILLVEMIKAECKRGMTVFDLGVGEARYKTTICNQTEELADSFVAISAKGRLAASIMRLAQKAKGAIKQSPFAFSLVKRVRAMVGTRSSRNEMDAIALRKDGRSE